MNYSLPDTITILFSAIFVIATFRKVRLSPVIGYIVAGAIIGPYGLNLAGYNSATKSLAEFGVVFLLFSVGLELTFERLMAMKKYIFALGSIQFVVTSVILALVLDLHFHNMLLSIIIGSSLSLSSTAIIFKMLSEEKSSNTVTGKISISVLLMQDLLVVPLFILIPVLGKGDINYYTLGGSILLKSVIAISIIIAAGRYLLRPMMHLIVSARYSDLFIATTLLLILSSAWVTEELGLSLGLGAFMAGVMLAETEFQPQVETTINQFKGLFLGFFFMTEIGMHFDFNVILDNFSTIIILASLFVLLKASIFYVLCRLFKIKNGPAVHASLLLAQGSEFAFVLFDLAKRADFLSIEQFQIMSLVVGISMALTPLIAGMGQMIENHYTNRSKKKQNPNDIPHRSDHVIIAGYGRVGEIVAKILDKSGIPYIAIDNDLRHVTKYFKKNQPVFYGDINHDTILNSLHIDEARAIILTIPDQKSLTKAAKVILKEYPETPLIVRAIDLDHYSELKDLGADMIIPEVYELGLQIGAEILTLSGSPKEEVKEAIEEVRNSFSNKATI